MTLREVAAELSATVHHGPDEELEAEVTSAAASDLMSDILNRVGTPGVMLTGLTTTQTIRTSAVAGIKCVVVVRGKTVSDQMIELAKEEEIVLMSTELTLFEASGLLYQKGLHGGVRRSG
jgi:hypothetical protein